MPKTRAPSRAAEGLKTLAPHKVARHFLPSRLCLAEKHQKETRLPKVSLAMQRLTSPQAPTVVHLETPDWIRAQAICLNDHQPASRPDQMSPYQITTTLATQNVESHAKTDLENLESREMARKENQGKRANVTETMLGIPATIGHGTRTGLIGLETASLACRMGHGTRIGLSWALAIHGRIEKPR